MTVSELSKRLHVGRGVVRSRVVDTIVHAAARVRYMFPDASPERHAVSVIRDVPYGPMRENRLDVYVPARSPKPLPVVMYVHGGGFAMLSKQTHQVMALAIARKGYLTFNIDYRLGVRNQFPVPLEDACAALLWVARNAATYGGDVSRLALAGESAGGNLVTALALVHACRRPEPFARRVFDASLPLRAVVATYPFLDVHDVHRLASHPTMSGWTKRMLLDASTSYVGTRVWEPRDETALHSPLWLLEQAATTDRPMPPFFVSIGTRDPLLSQSRRLKAALDRLGAKCELRIFPGEVHGFDALIWRAAAREKWRAAHAFLSQHTAVGA